MTGKIKDLVRSENGNGNGSIVEAKPPSYKLTSFQEKYMKRLIANFERAKVSVDQAQTAANDFIVACGEEQGIHVGAEGWAFDVESLEFVKIPQEQNSGEE